MEYETKKVSVIFIFRQDDKVLFLKREHTGACDGYYMLPGGHVDKDELVLTAAVRELKEELDVTVQPEDLVFRLVEPTRTHMHLFFEVLRYTGEIKNNEPYKHSDVSFLTLDNPDIHPFCVAELNAIAKGTHFLVGD